MDFRVFNLGLIDFKKAMRFQKEIFQEVKNNFFQGGLILCRHYPVITMGRQAKAGHIKVSPLELRNKGISTYETERAGAVTYHGPGQLTVYPIFNLGYFKKDIHLFLRRLEELAIDFFGAFGINSQRYDGLTGVWIEKKKIASIGIAIRNWITFHGMSINIKKDDLGNFELIKPCGMNIEMTSLESILGKGIEFGQIEGLFTSKFKDKFLLTYKGGELYG